MKRSLFITFLFLFFLDYGWSQPISSVKYDDMLAAADERMDDGDYFNALEWYRSAYRENKNADVALSIAYAYYKMRDFENANRYYSRVLEEDIDDIFIDDRYAYGRSLRSVGEPSQARVQFERLISKSTDQELKALAKNEIEGMTAAQGFEKNEDVIVQFADGGINSGSGEYSPAQFDEATLYFTSFKRNKEIVIDGKEKDYHARAYRSSKGDKGYSKPEELHRNINRDGFHIGNVAFTEDKRRMFFTRQQLKNDEVTSSRIYYSDMGDEDWGAAEILPSVNGEWIAKQPVVGELLGRRVLYFVSDMEGGFGGDDIYYVTLGGNIGPPVNLGETINSEYDEITPHYYDGTLFFSTEGRPGLGGFDIYSSTWDGTSWSEPENAGYNYNTQYDDFYLVFNSSGKNGYLVSNRPDEKKKKMKSETCCYDIYDFTIRELVINLLVGVADEEREPLDGATVELADQTIFDPPVSQTLPDEYRFNFDLDAERKYRVIASKEGYISDTVEFNTVGIIEDKEIRKIVTLKKKAPPAPLYTIDTVTINEPIRFDNIYYEFERWDILPESETDLTIILNLMNEYQDMVIELSSHTDSRGTKLFNQDLSQKRAESARNWLIDKGIDTSRIKAVGYGETKILNRCVDGRLCTDTEHRFNRRTEFTILEGPQTIEIKREVKTTYDGGKQSLRKFSPALQWDSFPVISFDQPVLDLGKMQQGEKKKLVYKFTNTGMTPLVIDLATACQCADITWPHQPINPGQSGEIVAIFDSAGMEGNYSKTIDIIANTDPIVVEAKFNVEIVLTE